MISFQNVSKRYGALEALSGVSFEAKPGEIYGYIGPNGAGKTTSLKIMAGLISVFGGDVDIDGHSLKKDRRAAQQLVGYVPQDAGFQEWRTVEHALTTFADLSGVSKYERPRRIEAVLEMLGIEENRKRKITHLSGGNVQKLRIAQALLHDPPVLILDEPLSGLDPSSRFALKEMLVRLKKEGKTILLSSHILSDIEDAADTIGILHEGSLLREGNPAALREEFRIGTVLRLATDAGDQAAADLDGIDAISEIEFIDATTLKLHIKTGVDADVVSREILSALLSAGRPIRSFARVTPSLEDVYISLTGGSTNGR